MDAALAALESMPLPGTKDELLARIPPARAALEATVRSLSTAELSASGPDVGWAVKDHLTHIATWEQMIAAHLRDGSDHAVVGMDAATYAQQSLDALNAAIYEVHRGRPVADVRARFAQAHDEMMDVLRAIDDSAFETPYWDDDPSMRTVMDKATGDTYRHYIEHLRWIEEQVSEMRARA